MPEYLIYIKNYNDKKTRKEKLFCPDASYAEKDIGKNLLSGEYIYNIENCQFPMGEIKPIRHK